MSRYENEINRKTKIINALKSSPQNSIYNHSGKALKVLFEKANLGVEYHVFYALIRRMEHDGIITIDKNRTKTHSVSLIIQPEITVVESVDSEINKSLNLIFKLREENLKLKRQNMLLGEELSAVKKENTALRIKARTLEDNLRNTKITHDQLINLRQLDRLVREAPTHRG